MFNISNPFSENQSENKEMSQSLNQGKKFKKYQNKIESSLEKVSEMLSGKEGFSDMYDDSLTRQTKHVINKYPGSDDNQQEILDNLRQEYQNTITEYQQLSEKIYDKVSEYLTITNPNNPYLNKNIRFTTGEVCYVTSKGVAKLIPSMDIWKTLNIPTTSVQLNIPWLDTYNTPGTIVASNPPLITGTPVVENQSLGNEGSNIFVSEFLPGPINPTFMGCYNPSPNNDNMTFIGGTPPSSAVSIQNGTFSSPVINNNSYIYITSSSEVPGWYFNAVLLNNSSAWGYPVPYPNGNQCVSIQRTQYISQLVNLNSSVNYTLTFYACGRNCCAGTLVNTIQIQLYTNQNAFISTIYTVTPPINKWTLYTVNFTVPTSQTYNLYFKGTISSYDQSTALQNISLSGVAEPGNYTYEQCKEYSIQNGYRYFALQNVNTSTSTGYCAVSNSSPAVSQYGTSQVQSKAIVLWSSGTSGQPGNTAILNNTGSIQVVNSSGKAMYSSPGDKISNYIGCYGDKSTRAMALYNGGSQQYSNSQCQQIAQQNNYQYYGLQNSTSGTNAQCALSNNLAQAQQYGIATNCTKLSDGTYSGGGWSNAIFATTPTTSSTYYLILQDDGTMTVYKGSGPNDNQGLIWQSSTSGKQQDSNSGVAASKGKYGQNWIANGATLAPGDFVGWPNGKISLLMQSDGNLVLYAYQMSQNCQKMNDGNMGGGLLGNAAYDIGKTANSSMMGKLGYIDGDANMYTYSTNETVLAPKNYSIINDANTIGNDINGASFGNATVDSCKTACDNNASCAGFVFDNKNKVCYPKNNNMYPYGSGAISTDTNFSIYVKNKAPKPDQPVQESFVGSSVNTINTDTLTGSNYINKGDISKVTNQLSKIASVDKQKLEHLQTKLNLLSNEITKLTNRFQTGTNVAQQQSYTNVSGVNGFLKDFRKTNKEAINIAKETSGNIQNILKDSDIVVLQKNYDYLFWSILATGAVLVSMNIVKK